MVGKGGCLSGGGRNTWYSSCRWDNERMSPKHSQGGRATGGGRASVRGPEQFEDMYPRPHLMEPGENEEGAKKGREHRAQTAFLGHSAGWSNEFASRFSSLASVSSSDGHSESACSTRILMHHENRHFIHSFADRSTMTKMVLNIHWALSNICGINTEPSSQL